METPKNPGELKSWLDNYTIGEVVLFLSLTFAFLALVNAAGIWIAQKFSN